MLTGFRTYYMVHLMLTDVLDLITWLPLCWQTLYQTQLTWHGYLMLTGFRTGYVHYKAGVLSSLNVLYRLCIRSSWYYMVTLCWQVLELVMITIKHVCYLSLNLSYRLCIRSSWYYMVTLCWQVLELVMFTIKQMYYLAWTSRKDSVSDAVDMTWLPYVDRF